MEILIILGLIVCAVYVFKESSRISDTESASPKTSTQGSKTTTAYTPEAKQVIKKTVPPTRRNLSWNNEADIAFAMGCIIAAFDAVGSITACQVGTSRNGLLRFYIILPSVTYSKLYERVPSDVIDFLKDNPQILSEEANGITLDIEKSFSIGLLKTPENISIATNGMLERVKRNAKEGAIKTMELTGMRNLRPIRLEIEGNYWHRTIRINTH